MILVLEPCPNCGSSVRLFASAGGRGSGNTTEYDVECPCGMAERGFPSNASGRRRDAAVEWNRFSRKKRATVSKLAISAPGKADQ